MVLYIQGVFTDNGFGHYITAFVVFIMLIMMVVESRRGRSAKRFRIYGIIIIICCILTYILSGIWYVDYYGPDKAIIKEGDMSWAHYVVTETKEHIFIPAIWLAGVLGLFGVFTTDKQLKDSKFRKSITLVSAFLILGIILLDVMGGIILAAIRAGVQGG